MSKLTRSIYKMVASGLGTGLFPYAPGTVGTFAAMVIALVLMQLFPAHDQLRWILGSLVVLGYLFGYLSIKAIAEEWGHDPGKVVIDEWIGYWLSLLFIPLHLPYLIAAFVLFRILDITKIMGISYFDNMKNVHGVLMDDLLAGLYTGLLIMIFSFII